MDWKKLFSKKNKSQLTPQEAKMKEVLEVNKLLLKSCEAHINADSRVSGLEALEILVGSATVMYEDKIRDAVSVYMVTGELPKGSIGETIKKTTDLTYGVKDKIEEKRQHKFPVVPNDKMIAEKQFETEENNGKKTIH